MAVKQGIGATSPDGSQYVVLTDGAGNLISGNTGTTVSTTATPADASTNTGINAQNNLAYNTVFNGTTWDRMRATIGASQTTPTGVLTTTRLPVATNIAGIPSTATTVAAGSLILKASAGQLYSVSCTTGASAGYLMIFNSTTVPADGVVTPVYVASIPATTTYSTDFEFPIYCATGCTLVFSTTGPFTKTISATAFLSGQIV
jgi:hypothetical protein